MASAVRFIDVDVIHECAIIRRGLVATLEQLPGIAFRHECSGLGDYLGLPEAARSDIAFVSARMGRQLLSTEVVKVSLIELAAAFGDLEAREALRVGVKGMLLLSAEPAELLDAAQRLALGQRYVTPTVSALFTDQKDLEALTTREQQILEFLAEGRCNKTIAKGLGIALGTVKTHVKSVLYKLEVNSRTEAVVVAARRGLVQRIEPRNELPAQWAACPLHPLPQPAWR